MVFEEAARLSHQYGQRWTMASALTPKVPAQFQCLTIGCSDPPSPKPASEAPPVPCLKELVQYITGFGSEDYSLEIRFKYLILLTLPTRRNEDIVSKPLNFGPEGPEHDRLIGSTFGET